MIDDEPLLNEFAQNGSEDAFAQLVSRHLNLVFGTALRHVRDPKLAEDVTQLVFINFARKAAALPPKTVLAGWLHRDTCFTSRDLLRKERRRLRREAEAMAMREIQFTAHENSDWDAIRPLIDSLLERLDTTDKSAVLLRYVEERSIRDVADRLHLSEAAAAKRLQRAIEKLRSWLAARGVTTTSEALSAVLAIHIAPPAPPALASLVTSTAFHAGIAAHSTSTATLLSMAKLKTFAIAAGLTAVAVAPVIIERQLAPPVRAAQTELVEQSRLIADARRQISAATESTSNTPRISDEEFQSIRALRSEIAKKRSEIENAPQPNPRARKMVSSIDEEDLPPDAIPRHAYVNAGFGSPSATMQTRLWAITTGHIDKWLDSFTPETRKVLAENMEETEPGEIPDGFKNGNSYKATGFRILGQRIASDGSLILKSYLEGEDLTLYDKMRQVNGEWKVERGGATRDEFLTAKQIETAPSPRQ